MFDVDNIPTFEESQRKFFKKKDNENKHLLVHLKGTDPEREHFGEKKKMVNIDVFVVEDDNSVTEYYNQWVDGAAIYGYLSKRPINSTAVHKLVKLPKQGGSPHQSWGLNSPDDQEKFNILIDHAKKQQEAVKEVLENEKAPLPWESDDDEDA